MTPCNATQVILAFVLLLAGRQTATATEFFVASDGNDRQAGTVDAPFATPARAHQAVHDLIARGLADNVVVTLRGGTYFLAEPLAFGVGDGGTERFSVSWQAAEGERVVLSGGLPITGWTETEGGLWRAPLPEIGREWRFRELFVNGQRRPRARHPDNGFLRAAPIGSEERTSFRTEPNSFPALTGTGNTELVFLHDWSISRIPLVQADPSTGTIHLAAPVGAAMAQFALFNFDPSPRFLLENDPAFLDSPGEWFLDVSTAVIYYRPFPDESPERLEAIAPVTSGLIVVRGDDRSGGFVRNLHFVGIDFEHSAWSLPAAGYAGVQATFYEERFVKKGHMWDAPVPAAVSFEIAENCSVVDCGIRHLGGSGIAFGSRCRGCTLARTVVQDVSANGVIVGEGTARTVGDQAWWQSAPEQAAAGNVVRDCLIERCGAQFFGGVGVWTGITAGTVVRNNLIRDLPYTGISVGWLWDPAPTPSRDNRIQNNRIERVMQLLSDGGGVYTLGNQPRMVIAGNVISSVPLSSGRAESNGIFVDEGSTGLTIQGNTIFDVAAATLRFHRAGANLVENNLLVLSPGAPPVRYNLTPEELITLRDNKIIPASQFVPGRDVPPSGPPPEVLSALEARSRQ